MQYYANATFYAILLSTNSNPEKYIFFKLCKIYNIMQILLSIN